MTDPLALISAYFEGVITEKEFAQLVAWLNEDEKHAKIFAWYSVQDRHVRSLLEREQTQGFLQAGNALDGIPETPIHDTDVCGITWEQLRAVEPDDSGSMIIDITEYLQEQERIRKEADRTLHRRQRVTGPDTVRPPRVLIVPKAALFGGIAAVITLLLIIILQGEPKQAPKPFVDGSNTPETPASVAVASVIDQSEARWGDASARFNDGHVLYSNKPVRLVSGQATIRFDNGAELVIHAPADIEPISGNRLALKQGWLTTYCPPTAHGFEVQTPNALITDRGTEFSVAVRDTGDTEVGVLTGAVDIQPGDPVSGWSGEAQRLAAGDGVVVNDATGQLSLVPAASLGFPSPALSRGYEQAVLADRPIAFWRFNEPEGRRLTDLGSLGAHGTPDGDPIGFAKPGFNPLNTGSAIWGPGATISRIHCGIHEAFRKPERLTIEGWIKLSPDSGDNAATTDQYEGRSGSEIEILFSTRSKPGDRLKGGIEVSVGRLGRYSGVENALFFSWVGLADWYCVGEGLVEDEWTHIAVTMRGTEIQWYINGEPRETKMIKSDFAPRDPVDGGVFESLGEVLLGNMSTQRRFFYGGIDEFAAFDRDLTPEQIKTHYRAGLPGRP